MGSLSFSIFLKGKTKKNTNEEREGDKGHRVTHAVAAVGGQVVTHCGHGEHNLLQLAVAHNLDAVGPRGIIPVKWPAREQGKVTIGEVHQNIDSTKGNKKIRKLALLQSKKKKKKPVDERHLSAAAGPEGAV
jgi:hypothetical protein